MPSETLKNTFYGPPVEPEDRSILDKYGRELVFRGDPYPAGKPNRAERRAAGVRHPIKFIEEYRDLLELMRLEEGLEDLAKEGYEQSV